MNDKKAKRATLFTFGSPSCICVVGYLYVLFQSFKNPLEDNGCRYFAVGGLGYYK